MFRHVVMLSFTNPLEQKDHDYITGVCADMQRELSGLVSLSFVANSADRSAGHTHAFVADFVDEASHENYQQAPIHVPLKNRITELAKSVVVLDYEF